MAKKHKKYKEYYGELLTINDLIEKEIYYADFQDHDELFKIIKELEEMGCYDILFDVDENFSDTLFFSTNEKTNFKDLMLILIQLRPDEFHEVSENCFRLWFD